MSSSNIINLRSYFDKAITKTDTHFSGHYKNYSLSIQLSLNEFSFSLLNTETHKHLAFESYAIRNIQEFENLAIELTKLLDQLDILKQKFKKINILFEYEKSTIIPFALFDENFKKDYFAFNFKLNNNEKIKFDRLKNLQAYNIYALPTPLHELIKNSFVDYNIIHSRSALIEGLIIKFKNQLISNRVLVNVRPSYMDILLFNNSKLLFCNIFKYITPEDFAYFLLSTLEQLQLNPAFIDVYLLGEIDKNSKLYELLYKYIRNIEFMERNEFYDYSYVLDELPPHHYYNLLNANMCEL